MPWSAWELGSGQGKVRDSPSLSNCKELGSFSWVWVLSWVRVWLVYRSRYHSKPRSDLFVILKLYRICANSCDQGPNRLQVRCMKIVPVNMKRTWEASMILHVFILPLCYSIYLSHYFSVQCLLHTLHEWMKNCFISALWNVKLQVGISLVVQWLRFCTSIQWVGSILTELRSHILSDVAKNKKLKVVFSHSLIYLLI